MSIKNSPAVSQWVNKFQTSIHHQTNVVDLATSYVEHLSDSLIIEDLDFSDLEINSSSVRTSLSSTGKNDYEFEEQIPGVVSEACTQNNLYILVRVPTNPKKLVKTMSSSVQTTPKMSGESPRSHLNVNRTIFPILEEEVPNSFQEASSSGKTSKTHKVTCWTKESQLNEEFSSKTNIICDTIPCLLPNQVPDPSEKEELFVSDDDNHPVPIRCQNQIELQELNSNSIHLKGPPNVSLENYGILITPTKMPKTENLLVFQVDTEAEETKSRKDSSCFQWLRKLFHIKQRKSGLVHAKVYKTYFVKWKKCSEENECSCPRKEIYAKGHNLRRNSA